VILCDVVNVWLVGLLAPVADAGRRRLMYALHPLAIIVAAVHGQVEPIALAFVLAGLVFLRRGRDLPAGAAFGLAIAAKTWPVLVVVPVLLSVPRRAMRIALSTVCVVLIFFMSSVVFLSASPPQLARALMSYGSFVGFWGWAGYWLAFGHLKYFGYYSPARTPSTVLVIFALGAVLIAFRSSDVLRRAWTPLLATLSVAAGFGPQYLVWPVPFLTASDEPQFAYAAGATMYALAFYVPLRSGQPLNQGFLSGLSWLIIAAMVSMLWAAGKQEHERRLAQRTGRDVPVPD
jgi:hypothetical protein